jgi:hypothetical protein
VDAPVSPGVRGGWPRIGPTPGPRGNGEEARGETQGLRGTVPRGHCTTVARPLQRETPDPYPVFPDSGMAPCPPNRCVLGNFPSYGATTVGSAEEGQRTGRAATIISAAAGQAFVNPKNGPKSRVAVNPGK